MKSPNKIRTLKKIVPHVIIMYIGTLLYLGLEKGLMGDSQIYPATGNLYEFKISVIISIVVGGVLGLIVGSLEELYFKKLLKRKPFGQKVIMKVVLYLLIIILFISALSFPVNSYVLDLPLFDSMVFDAVLEFTHKLIFYSMLLYISVFIGISLFFSEMVDHIGTKEIANFFTGKYHSSKSEERIFMFLDMKSSTTIAENIGHEKYFELLNNYYEDMTDAIVKSGGEIYQYVGDEIVVSWELSTKVENNRCLDCFFMIYDNISKNESLYLKHFGLQPKFKAAIHSGKVTAGEIGVVKKDILFLGDVLNTTSRIQDLCNELESTCLISEELCSNLATDDKYSFEEKGEFVLKGKDHKVRLFDVKRT